VDILHEIRASPVKGAMGVWCTFRGREMLGMFQLGLTSDARVEHRNSTKRIYEKIPRD
jgi:hypothetical protein